MDDASFEDLNYDSFLEIISNLDVPALRSLYQTNWMYHDWLQEPHTLLLLANTYKLPAIPESFSEFLMYYYAVYGTEAEQERLLEHLVSDPTKSGVISKLLDRVYIPHAILEEKADTLVEAKKYRKSLLELFPYLRQEWFLKDHVGNIVREAPLDFIQTYLTYRTRVEEGLLGTFYLSGVLISREMLEQPELLETLLPFFTEEAVAYIAVIMKTPIRYDILTEYVSDLELPVHTAVSRKAWDKAIDLVARGYPVSSRAATYTLAWTAQTPSLRKKLPHTNTYRMKNPHQGVEILRATDSIILFNSLSNFNLDEIPYILTCLTPQQRVDVFWLDLFSENSRGCADILFRYGLVPRDILRDYYDRLTPEDPIIVGLIEHGWITNVDQIRPLSLERFGDRKWRTETISEQDLDDYLKPASEIEQRIRDQRIRDRRYYR